MSEQVVKAKNEGRVAAGKRLAEWNRKNKEDLLKNKNQVSSSAATSTNEVSLGTSPSTYSSSSVYGCLLYTSPSPRDGLLSRMPSSA